MLHRYSKLTKMETKLAQISDLFSFFLILIDGATLYPV